MNTHVDLGVVCQSYSLTNNAKSILTFLMTFFFASSVKLDKNSASSAEIPWPGWSSRCITAASFSVILLVSVWMQTRCQVPSQVRSTSTPWGICRNATSNVKRMGLERKSWQPRTLALWLSFSVKSGLGLTRYPEVMERLFLICLSQLRGHRLGKRSRDRVMGKMPSEMLVPSQSIQS